MGMVICLAGVARAHGAPLKGALHDVQIASGLIVETERALPWLAEAAVKSAAINVETSSPINQRLGQEWLAVKDVINPLIHYVWVDGPRAYYFLRWAIVASPDMNPFCGFVVYVGHSFQIWFESEIASKFGIQTKIGSRLFPDVLEQNFESLVFPDFWLPIEFY